MDAAVQEGGGGIEEMDPIRYTTYMELIARAFKGLLAYYGQIELETQTSEAESMALYVQKILATVTALRLKYSFSPSHFMRPGVDLADSGFPYFHDIMVLDADLSTREERLPKMPEIERTRESMLDYLLRPETDIPVRQYEDYRTLQWQVAERAYLESLDLRAQFFRFTPGKLFGVDPSTFSVEQGRRGYRFSWGCYDSLRNRPCVYFMLMAQDEREVPLDQKDNPEYVRFLQTVDGIASRAPEQLAAIAVRLDEAFGALYPKALKRFCLGPIVSPLIADGAGSSVRSSKLSQILLPVMQQAEIGPNDFALFFTAETIISQREEMSNNLSLRSVLGMDKPRQIFRAPPTDQKLVRRGATSYHDYCIMPHRLRQHLSDQVFGEVKAVLNVDDLELISYQHNQTGGIDVG